MPQLKPARGICLERTHPLARGFVGCWLFNEGSGNKVFDLSGNQSKYLGDFVSAVTWKTGKSGPALHFAGDGDFVKLGIWSGEPKVTIFVRVKFEEAIGAIEHIMTADSPSDNYRTFQFRRESGGRIEFIPFVGGASKSVIGSTVLTTGLWWDVIAVNDGTYARVYVNGVEDATPVASGNMDNDPAAWVVGVLSKYDDFTDLIADFEGRIEFEMRWDVALSASEIALLCREPFCMFERRAGTHLSFVPAVVTRRSRVGFKPIAGEDRLRGLRRNILY